MGLRDLLALRSEWLALGLPPPVAAEPTFRAWCRKLARLCVSGTRLSAPQADDRAAELFSRIVQSDALWGRAYPLIRDFVVPAAEPLMISLEAAGSVGIGTAAQCLDVLNLLGATLRVPGDFS